MRLDMAALTLGQLADASDLLGTSVTDALQGSKRERAMIALAYVIIHADDPSFTLEDAGRLRMADLEVVNADPEANAGGNGNEPRPSPASGGSIPAT